MPQSKSPTYAARVNIVKKVKVGWEWKTLSVVRDDKGRIRWDYVLVNGQPDHHPEGTYYLDYYDDGRRKREAAGGTANEVLEQARRKALLLESRDAGLDVKDVDSPEHRLVTAAIEKFLISRMLSAADAPCVQEDDGKVSGTLHAAIRPAGDTR